MGKPFRINRFVLLAAVIFSLVALQHTSGYKHVSLCSPVCRISVAKNLPGEVLAADPEIQETTQTSTGKSTLTSPPIRVVHPEVPRIPAKELKELLEKKSDFILVDTNPVDSYELWHIPGAVNIPYASMEGTAERDAMLAQLPKDKLIVFYCLCEEGGDSSEMALLLRRMDYRRDRIKVLEGGFIQWDAKGFPTFKKEIPDEE